MKINAKNHLISSMIQMIILRIFQARKIQSFRKNLRGMKEKLWGKNLYKSEERIKLLKKNYKKII